MAYLAFGFQLQESYPFTQTGEHGDVLEYWLDSLCERAGIHAPAEDADYDDPQVQAQHEHYLLASQALVQSLGCKIEQFGYERNPEFFVQLELPRDEGSSFCCKALDLDAMKAVDNESNRNRLRHFCGVMGIEYHEPRWHMLDSFGDD